MKRILIAIIDNKSSEMVGNYIYVHRHIATAVRMFQDAASDKQSMLSRHLQDFDLVQLGEIDDNNDITLGKEILITGKALQAANEKPATKTQHDFKERQLPVGDR